MRNSLNDPGYGALRLLVGVALTSLACSGSPGGTVPAGSGADGSEQSGLKPAVVCGVRISPGGEPEPEIYMLEAMNAKLAYYPEFAAAIGMNTVTDCESARTFKQRYAEYDLEHQGFDDFEPRIPSAEPEPPMPALPSGSSERPKLLGGTETVKIPVVQVIYRTPNEGDPSMDNMKNVTRRCSGTFIAKNWILTAAHCLSAQALTHCLLAGTPNDECVPNAHTWGEWTIRLPLAMDGDDMTWYELEHVLMIGYINELWTGLNPGMNEDLCFPNTNCSPDNDAEHDMALLFVPDDTRLPPEIELGGAMRLQTSDFRDMDLVSYGWGLPTRTFGEHVLRTGTLHAPFSFTPNLVINDRAQGSADPLICSGDSGGPLVRKLDVDTNTGHQSVDVIVATAVDTILVSGTRGECTDTGAFQMRFSRVDAHFNFIKEKIRRWPGLSKFECNMRVAPNGQAAECWGTPCVQDAKTPEEPRGCEPDQYCSRSGREFTSRGVTFCDTCGGACDCIVGQCLPTPE